MSDQIKKQLWADVYKQVLCEQGKRNYAESAANAAVESYEKLFGSDEDN